MLKANNLSKKFADFAVLQNISLHAESSQIYGLVGSNGCGKTTLLKHIMGIYRKDTGELHYKDQLVTENSEVLKRFYYVQDDLFFPNNFNLNALYDYEKLLYKNMSKKKYDNLVKFFDIDTSIRLSKMSKGQKKQAAFVLAIAAQPEVLLLDEIVDGLDAVVRRKFWSVLIKEVIDREMTVIISSHALKELDNICDKVGIMHEGQIIKEEKMDTLKEGITRVQFAVEGEYQDLKNDQFNMIKTSKIGSVYFCVLQGNIDAFRKTLYDTHRVLIFDILPMNLEEIFITELGGVGYGVEDYVTE